MSVKEIVFGRKIYKTVPKSFSIKSNQVIIGALTGTKAGFYLGSTSEVFTCLGITPDNSLLFTYPAFSSDTIEVDINDCKNIIWGGNSPL